MSNSDWGRLKVNLEMTGYRIVCMISEQMFQMTLNWLRSEYSCISLKIIIIFVLNNTSAFVFCCWQCFSSKIQGKLLQDKNPPARPGQTSRSTLHCCICGLCKHQSEIFRRPVSTNHTWEKYKLSGKCFAPLVWKAMQERLFLKRCLQVGISWSTLHFV